MALVKCSNCGKEGLVWSANRRINPVGKLKPWLIDPQSETDHHCIKPGHRDKNVNIKNSEQRGFPCFEKCGTFIVKDETLEPPQYREVIQKLKGVSEVYFDVEHGAHHTVERCIEIKEFKHIRLTADQEGVKTMIKVNAFNIEEGKRFDPTIQTWPADLFILVGFEHVKKPVYVRNPKYHNDIGYYTGPKSN